MLVQRGRKIRKLALRLPNDCPEWYAKLMASKVNRAARKYRLINDFQRFTVLQKYPSRERYLALIG